MSNSNKKWTKREERVVLRQVKVSPQNLQLAFNAAAIELGRTPGACQTRWYEVISKDTSKTAKVFYCISKKSVGVNRKNCKTLLTTKEKRGFWSSIFSKLFV